MHRYIDARNLEFGLPAGGGQEHVLCQLVPHPLNSMEDFNGKKGILLTHGSYRRVDSALFKHFFCIN